jgi:hypothetical protein
MTSLASRWRLSFITWIRAVLALVFAIVPSFVRAAWRGRSPHMSANKGLEVNWL